MTTFIELAKAAMPGATDAEAEFVLWNHTPFPFSTEPRVLFKKISGYRRACANGIQLCETCSRIAADGWNCEQCNAALAAARTETRGLLMRRQKPWRAQLWTDAASILRAGEEAAP